jgi:hypothetical protein
MKIKCGPTQAEIDKRAHSAALRKWAIGQWHDFYPIWPRQVAKGDCRCFEWIERRWVPQAELNEQWRFDADIRQWRGDAHWQYRVKHSKLGG